MNHNYSSNTSLHDEGKNSARSNAAGTMQNQFPANAKDHGKKGD
jgi:hypothetical protein